MRNAFVAYEDQRTLEDDTTDHRHHHHNNYHDHDDGVMHGTLNLHGDYNMNDLPLPSEGSGEAPTKMKKRDLGRIGASKVSFLCKNHAVSPFLLGK
jgi:hypothetical protein